VARERQDGRRETASEITRARKPRAGKGGGGERESEREGGGEGEGGDREGEFATQWQIHIDHNRSEANGVYAVR